jgi:phenylalanyl-tRNA synthetase beta chain
MIVSLNWLSALLGRDLAADDVAQRLAMLGAPVEAAEDVRPLLEGVVVGLVERAEKHPNADRLTLCHVNNGREVVEVVCGAPVVKQGSKYPYAPEGTVLPGGLKLEARKIRGVVSHGMLCSARELELGTEHEGIMEIRTDAAPGTRLLDALPLEDTRLDLEVTANRPDLLCHKGVARELGVAYGVPVKLPAIPDAPGDDGGASRRVKKKGSVGGVDVIIEDIEGCPRYMAAVIRGVEVGPSPTWLEARLRAIGARPINNVVDATNYVLYELNQPMHAFDLAKVRGDKIVVRRAAPGEGMTTLDGEQRELTPEMTMICDGSGATAIGGVMGGAESEVSETTTDVLLECAYFDPPRIRQTRQALKMSTEASYRFERGTDYEAMPDALSRAVQLIRAVAGGAEPEPAIDVYPKPFKARTVPVRPERVTHLLGMPIEREEIERILVGLGFPVAPKGAKLHVQVPGWRPDVAREIDLIEEVARVRGYGTFPTELLPFRVSVVPDDPIEPLRATIRRVMTGMGLNEARSLSLTSVGGDEARRVLNPLSAEDAYLRADLLGGLVRSAERNWAVRERDVRLFETGRVFHEAGEPRPREEQRLAGVISGERTPPHWTTQGKAPDYDAWDVKAMFEEAVRVAGPEGVVVETDGGWELLDEDGARRGWAGALEADRPPWAAQLYGFEVDVVVWDRPHAQHRALPTTPPVERDVALVLPEGVSAAAVESVMGEVGGALLVVTRVFDEYRGDELAGRSVAWRLVFRAPDRTLRDREADEALGAVLAALKERLGVERRQA